VTIVFLGLSITSSWGNGHATNYRALLHELEARGHDVLFLERDVPWYAASRDFEAPFVSLYSSLAELRERHEEDLRGADLVVVGSFVPEGVRVGEWALEVAGGPVAFWDIDTPVTAAKLARGDHEYLTPELLGRYDLYLSFTGGPLLEQLGAQRPRPFYCMVDPTQYRPVEAERRFVLGYLGTYSPDRQETLRELLLEPAHRLPQLHFAVAGPQYPDVDGWPANVEHFEHVPPAEHARFYASQRLTLNVTRQAMVESGWSPSVRLFEAAACGVAIVSDWWPGLDSFFVPGEEILVARSTDDVLRILRETDGDEVARIAAAARRRVLGEHTAERRAEQLEAEVAELVGVAA
jgi:spore maturation protein CgeB